MNKLNKYLIITNNETIKQKYEKLYELESVDGGYLEVLLRVRDRVHHHYKVITHPLMGSVKPNETPYRSIILQQGDVLDFQSLNIIESSIEVCNKFLKDKATPEWPSSILEDFRYVDDRLFQSALETISL